MFGPPASAPAPAAAAASGPARVAGPPARLWPVDLARSAALLAMAVYHFVYDLTLFGVVAPGTALLPGWRWLAYLTAGSFLFLAGVGLWLAHGRALRVPAAARRIAKIGLAAAVVTLATYLAVPDAFIFFGILHAIAVGSLIGLGLLRLPVAVLLLLGVGVLALPQAAQVPSLSAPVWWWLGLQGVPVRAVDYVPLFPWLGPLIWGIAAAKWAEARGLWARMAVWSCPAWAARAAWPGRHSLWVYLVHQPVLIAAIWAVLSLLG
jgi:uncharacterized membrane protein